VGAAETAPVFIEVVDKDETSEILGRSIGPDSASVSLGSSTQTPICS